MPTRTVTAAHALLPDGLRRDVAITLDGERDGARIIDVRPASREDGAVEPGLVVPGLVNAHLHLELGWAAGRVPGGDGLAPWVGRVMALQRPPAPELDATPLVDAGTAAVCDIANGGNTADALAGAGLPGIVQHELLGLRRDALSDRLAAAAAPDRRVGGITVRPSPHATYSTPAELIRAACRPSSAPASIHLGEDPAEAAFTGSASGPLAEMLDRSGIDWRWWPAPGLSPARYLEALGVLGPALLLVHAVHVDPDDLALIRARRAPVCLCPRSNVHVGGRLPDVAALTEAGIPLCLGTDSLASCPDLDVLGDVAVLARAFPSEPVERWLQLATAGGADALWLRGLGRIEVGAAPGLVRLHVDAPDALRDGAPPRAWVVRPAPNQEDR